MIAPPHHPLSTKRKVSLEALAGERYVNRRAGSGTRAKVESVMNEYGVDPDGMDVVAEMGSTQAVISAVQAGMGISIVSRKAAEYPARSGLIAMKELSGADLTREFFVVYSSERQLSVAADAFLKTACDEK